MQPDSAGARARVAQRRYAPAESRALGLIALLAAVALLWLVLPVGIGVLMGALLAFAVDRPYRRVLRRAHRPALVALVATVAMASLTCGAVATLAYLLFRRGVAVMALLPGALAPGGPIDRLVEALARPLSPFRLDPQQLLDQVRSAAGGIASWLAQSAAQVAGLLVDGALALFLMALTMFFVLVHWAALARHVERLLPLNPHHTRRLMRDLVRIGRQTIVGNFGTAILQGLLAGVAYAIAPIPQAGFFGAMTAVAALIPGLGTLLVWVPVSLVLFVEHRPGYGTFELLWGALVVVGLCDYVVRPRLIGRGEATSTWLTYVSLFGGLKLFGFVGFLLGPLVAGISVSALRVHERTRRFRLTHPPSSGPAQT